jgi:hypothetical protein
MSDRTSAEYVVQIRKLGKAYHNAAGRFTKSHDLKEMRSVAIEIKAITAEAHALIKELIRLETPQ